MREGEKTIKKSILAVLDKEKEYVKRFMAYVNQIKEEDFLVLAFSNVDSFLACCQEEQIEVLLISEDLFLDLKDRKTEVYSFQIVMLYEGGSINVEEYYFVYKYQAVQKILEEVRNIYIPKKRPIPIEAVRAENYKKVIAVYSASGGSKKTCFSLGLAQILGVDNKCLYLNFDYFSGFFELMEKSDKGMSEFIYYLKQTEENPFLKSIHIKQSFNGFDYYLPANHPFDLLELDVPDSEYLLQVMRNESDYNYLILDIGIWNKAMFALLSKCDVIYYPLSRGNIDERKLKEFRRFLLAEEKESILEKMITITIPEDKRMQDYFEIPDLAKGTMGAYIESVLLDRKEQENGEV